MVDRCQLCTAHLIQSNSGIVSHAIERCCCAICGVPDSTARVVQVVVSIIDPVVDKVSASIGVIVCAYKHYSKDPAIEDRASRINPVYSGCYLVGLVKPCPNNAASTAQAIRIGVIHFVIVHRIPGSTVERHVDPAGVVRVTAPCIDIHSRPFHIDTVGQGVVCGVVGNLGNTICVVISNACVNSAVHGAA